MLINKIQIINFLGNKDKPKEWNMDKFLYLYGPNGIGKTTFLDSIYIAITNDLKINDYSLYNEGAQETGNRILEFQELQINFKDNGDIRLKGAYEENDFKNVYKEAKKMVSEDLGGNQNLTQIKQYLSEIHEYFNYNKKSNDDTIEEFIIKIMESKEETEEITNEKDKIQQIAYRVNTEHVNQAAFSRKQFLDKIDVLYLTIDRMKPKKSNCYDEEAFYFYGHRSLITPTIAKILKDFNQDLKNFINDVFSVLNETLVDLIKCEWNKNPQKFLNEDDVKEKIKNNNKIVEFVLNSLDFPKEIISNILSNDKDLKNKPNSRRLINVIISKLKNTSKNIESINKFIKEANIFFSLNDKEICWNYKNMNVMIKDKGKEKEISEYIFSSGEQQIITILFNLYFHKKDNLLILMDEPELSLSIDWQEKMFEVIDKENNVQVIAVTHSPFVVPQDKFGKYLQGF